MNNKINEECLDIYKTKIEVNNKINSLMRQKTCEYQLIDLKNEEGEILKELNIYIVKLMTYLWEEPKLVVNLISTADKADIIESLAPLIVNNFYENILSPNYIEDSLLYVITLLLKEEINKLKNINDYSIFLNETPCSYLLQELNEKKDIQTFFKLIITKAVEKLESNCSNKDLIFNLSKIEEEIRKKENLSKKNDKNDNKSIFTKIKKNKNDIVRNTVNNIDPTESLELESELNISRSILFEPKLFKEKYFTNFSKEKIIEEKEKSKSYSNKKKENENENEKNDIYDIYLNKLSSDENQNQSDVVENYIYNKKNKYDNEEFLIDLDNDEKVRKIYMDHFYRVLECINIIISNMLENLYFLPYSVKCICKIISILIKQKFPNSNIIEQNAFISRFFFTKLFLPFFLFPAYEALITNILISKKTVNNLRIIGDIILKLVSGELFMSDLPTNEFTPFNLFFIEKMPEIANIFKEIKKVNLPNFIEKYLNDQLPEDFKFNYFNEYPEEIVIHRSICFKMDDINAIIKTIGKKKELFFSENSNKGLKKTYEKLCNKSSKFIMNEINKKQTLRRNLSLKDTINIKDKLENKYIKTIKLPKAYYFLISDILINEKYKTLFKLEQKEPNFRIDELKTVENDTDIIQNNLIRVKNSICSILYNYHSLIKKDFPEGTTIDTKSIFNEINKYIKSNNYLIDDSIPTQWFLNCLLENLQKIPETYTNNDYELLYDEIEKDINNSIENVNFDTICFIHEKLNYAKRLKNNYEKKKKNLKKIKLNDKINNIIEKISIPVALYFDYDKKLLKIEKANVNVKQLQLMDDIVIVDTKKNCMICKTIKIFTNEFPNLTKYQTYQDIDLFKFEKDLDLPERLQEYFDIIKEHLQKCKILNENNLNIIGNKLYDYILGKLYDKIFPKEHTIDDKIFRQSVFLSWIEPKHFIQDKKNYIFDGFLPDVNNFLKKLEKQKSPRKKFSYMSKIFELIRNLVKFNGGDIMTGVDDQMPILNYALIKARPLRIYSNCKFMELFLGDRRNKKEDSELIQLLSLCDYICNMSYSKLINVSKEEYNLKCKEAANNDDFKKS